MASNDLDAHWIMLVEAFREGQARYLAAMSTYGWQSEEADLAYETMAAALQAMNDFRGAYKASRK